MLEIIFIISKSLLSAKLQFFFFCVCFQTVCRTMAGECVSSPLSLFCVLRLPTLLPICSHLFITCSFNYVHKDKWGKQDDENRPENIHYTIFVSILDILVDREESLSSVGCQPHQTLKCSQQREFCQFSNGLGHHDLFSSLAFSPVPEFGIVFIHFTLVHCTFPWTCFKIHDNMKVCSVIIWPYPQRPHLSSLYVILISLFDNSSFHLGCSFWFSTTQTDAD